jgi:predicted acyltransferase
MTANQRFTALDVFRGMTICLMIIVNTPGDGESTFAPLLHAKWHGFTPTDLVFPSFLFVVGNAMSFVMKKWEQKTTAEVLAKIFKRTLIIFLLGYLMYWFPFVRVEDGHWSLSPISQTRILGVLQRIALCYGFAALMIYFLKPKLTVIISVALLLLYWALCFWYGDPFDPLSLQGNAGLYFDRWLMGDAHIYHGEGVAFDPEGWLSTLPAIVNVVAGYVVGQYVQQKGKTYEGLTKIILAGFGLMVIAYFWNFIFPINKKLWTSSFVLHTVGLDCMLLGAVIYIVDIKKQTRWTGFFEAFGKNPLFIYLLSELLVILMYTINVGPDLSLYRWIYLNIFSYGGEYWGSLLFAVCYMLLCWSVGYWLDRKKIYVRV